MIACVIQVYCKVLIDVIYYVFIVGTLSTSTISAMDTTSVTIPIIHTTASATFTIPTITASDISPSTSANLCAVSPSSTACIMAVEDDETGNDTIWCVHMCVRMYVHKLARVIDNVEYICTYVCLLQMVCRVGLLSRFAIDLYRFELVSKCTYV